MEGMRWAGEKATHHWLALVNGALGIWAGLPWLAPVFMAAGLEPLGRLIYILYMPFCHQLPQRSWFLFGKKFTYSWAEIAQVWPDSSTFAGLRFFYGTPEMGYKLAWSDRMVSLYGGLFLAGLAYALARRWLRRPLSWRQLVVLLMPMAVDSLTHLVSDITAPAIVSGFRDSNGWLATLTGHAFRPEFYAGDAWGSFNSIMRLATGLMAAFALVFFTFPHVDRALGLAFPLPPSRTLKSFDDLARPTDAH